ncbi:MAG: GspL/Epsl periplasmic domain-containing protein [Alcaligenes sp.]
MKNVLRLYLDSSSGLAGAPVLDFVLRDRRGQVLRRGSAPLEELREQGLARAVELILPPDLATTTQIRIPAVSAARRAAVVNSAVEPLCLSPLEQVWVACGRRLETGLADVAWAERAHLLALGEQARVAGLSVSGVYAWSERHAQDRAGQGDAVQVSDCSLLMPDMAAQGGQAFVRLALWALVAVLAWALVWQQQARSLRQEVRSLRTQMEQSLRQTLPQLPVVVAPLVQARQHRDALLGERGGAPALFDRLLLGAAAQWPSLEGRVRALNFKDGALGLVLASDAALEPAEADSELQWQAGDSPREVQLRMRKAPGAGGQP